MLTHALCCVCHVCILGKDGWEANMMVDCKTKLAVRPQRAHAVLFYSQHPDGTLDRMSKHGGCPVIKGTKWAANLWIWNKVSPCMLAQHRVVHRALTSMVRWNAYTGAVGLPPRPAQGRRRKVRCQCRDRARSHGEAKQELQAPTTTTTTTTTTEGKG